MKYKVGDKVRVRKDLKENTFYNGIGFAREMEQFCGKVAEIDKVFDDSSGVYYIKEDRHGYAWNEDKYLQDILHKLELEETSIVEKIELATKLSESRKKRRKNKDIVETTGAIKEWINENKKSINSLKQLLGKVRKIEEYHENRTYTPKILN